MKVVDDGLGKKELDKAFTGKGKIVNSEFLNGLEISEAKDRIINELEKKGVGLKKLYIV